MRQLLNNPWVVAGLCLAALVVVFSNVTLPPSGGELGVDRGSGVQGVISDRRSLTADNQLPSYEANLLGWKDSIPRDPFRLADNSKTSEKGAATEDSPPMLATQILHLEAVIMEPGDPLAVINGIIVAEGESLEEYHVIKIQSDGVWLEGPEGRARIEFNDGTTGANENDEDE